jgi:hypothetical protein
MKTIFDPSFRCSSSFDTDLKKTFARIRRTHREGTARAAPAPAASLGNVSSIARLARGRDDQVAGRTH